MIALKFLMTYRDSLLTCLFFWGERALKQIPGSDQAKELLDLRLFDAAWKKRFNEKYIPNGGE